MPSTQLNNIVENLKQYIKINLEHFYILYDKSFVLKWVLVHLPEFETELEKIINNIAQELKVITKDSYLELDSIIQSTLVASFNKAIQNATVFKKHVVQKFTDKFLNFLQQCELQCNYLSKTITCKHCNAIYTLLSTTIVDNSAVICPVCLKETSLNITGNALLNIETIYNILKA